MGEVAAFVGILGAFFGAYGGALKAEEDVRLAEQKLERAEIIGGIASAGAEAANRLEGGHALQTYETNIANIAERTGLAVTEAQETQDTTEAAATATFDLGITGNVTKQGETRRKANIQALDVGTQGLLGGGATTARLAGSGVRGTGSAAGLMTESNRLFDIGVSQIDEELAAQEKQYGLGRDVLREQRDQTIGGSLLTESQLIRRATRTGESATKVQRVGLEQTLENITGDQFDIAAGTDLDALFASLDVADVDGITGWTDDLLTETQTAQFAFLQEDIDLESSAGNKLTDILIGGVSGGGMGVPFIKL